jgi:hypothetical protein
MSGRSPFKANGKQMASRSGGSTSPAHKKPRGHTQYMSSQMREMMEKLGRQIPGPGQYEPKVPRVGQSGPKYTHGTRRFDPFYYH